VLRVVVVQVVGRLLLFRRERLAGGRGGRDGGQSGRDAGHGRGRAARLGAQPLAGHGRRGRHGRPVVVQLGRPAVGGRVRFLAGRRGRPGGGGRLAAGVQGGPAVGELADGQRGEPDQRPAEQVHDQRVHRLATIAFETAYEIVDGVGQVTHVGPWRAVLGRRCSPVPMTCPRPLRLICYKIFFIDRCEII